jgi:hypothetical protein
MEGLRNARGALAKFENGSRVGLDVGDLIENLEGFDMIKVLTTAEMWRNGSVPKKYSLYTECMMPHLDMVNFMTWQEGKEADIVRALDSGLSPSQMGPIHANFNIDRGLFSIANGITRIRVYNKKRIDYIPAKLYLGDNSS